MGWLSEIDKNATSEVSKMIVGNKCDQVSKKVVDFRTAKDLADKHGILLFETSARTNQNVDVAFLDITRAIKHRVEKAQRVSEEKENEEEKKEEEEEGSQETTEKVLDDDIARVEKEFAPKRTWW